MAATATVTPYESWCKALYKWFRLLMHMFCSRLFIVWISHRCQWIKWVWNSGNSQWQLAYMSNWRGFDSWIGFFMFFFFNWSVDDVLRCENFKIKLTSRFKIKNIFRLKHISFFNFSYHFTYVICKSYCLCHDLSNIEIWNETVCFPHLVISLALWAIRFFSKALQVKNGITLGTSNDRLNPNK